MTLRDALEMWNRGEIVVEVSPGRWQAIHKATDALIGAARRVAEAPEVWWCRNKGPGRCHNAHSREFGLEIADRDSGLGIDHTECGLYRMVRP